MKTVDKLENNHKIYNNQQNSVLSQFTNQIANRSTIQQSLQSEGQFSMTKSDASAARYILKAGKAKQVSVSQVDADNAITEQKHNG